ncbi:MAG: PIN domain-containing protein [Luteolibacter sp.]
MIYIDTSSLLKLFILDEHLRAVTSAIYRESAVVVSPLTELEASVQLKGTHLGGGMGPARYARMHHQLVETLENDPFVKRALVNRIFSSAIAQHSASSVHCRSLDRLHLAAMAELGIKRLMTHDFRQAAAARELGYEVVSPGLE